MYSSGTIAIGNTVKNSLGHLVLEWHERLFRFYTFENNLIYNPRGLYLDQSYHPRTVNVFERNNILYNSSGVQFQVSREKVF